MTSVVWAAATDVGRARERNEDSWFGGNRIFAVADGLGGHRAGEVASRMAVEAMARLDKGGPKTGIGPALVAAIEEANRAVTERAGQDPETAGMATTITALAIDGGMAHLGHVGDSRCYLLRGDQMTLVSSDHTLVARMVDEGAITLEQAETHPQRSVITRALGTDANVDVDLTPVALAPGDRWVLCSDGLSSVVPESEIAGLLASIRDPNETCRALIDEANRRGGPDNITVVIVDVPADADLPAVEPQALEQPPEPSRPVAPPGAARARARRKVPRRAVAWTVAIVVVLVGGFIGLRVWADNSWFVGFQDDQVAIFRGLQTDFVIPLNRVHEKTGPTRDQVAPFYVGRLDEGIPAATLKKAKDIVANIPRADPSFTPLPPFTPSPIPSASGSPS